MKAKEIQQAAEMINIIAKLRKLRRSLSKENREIQLCAINDDEALYSEMTLPANIGIEIVDGLIARFESTAQSRFNVEFEAELQSKTV